MPHEGTFRKYRKNEDGQQAPDATGAVSGTSQPAKKHVWLKEEQRL